MVYTTRMASTTTHLGSFMEYRYSLFRVYWLGLVWTILSTMHDRCYSRDKVVPNGWMVTKIWLNIHVFGRILYGILYLVSKGNVKRQKVIITNIKIDHFFHKHKHHITLVQANSDAVVANVSLLSKSVRHTNSHGDHTTNSTVGEFGRIRHYCSKRMESVSTVWH